MFAPVAVAPFALPRVETAVMPSPPNRQVSVEMLTRPSDMEGSLQIGCAATRAEPLGGRLDFPRHECGGFHHGVMWRVNFSKREPLVRNLASANHIFMRVRVHLDTVLAASLGAPASRRLDHSFRYEQAGWKPALPGITLHSYSLRFMNSVQMHLAGASLPANPPGVRQAQSTADHFGFRPR